MHLQDNSRLVRHAGQTPRQVKHVATRKFSKSTELRCQAQAHRRYRVKQCASETSTATYVTPQVESIPEPVLRGAVTSTSAPDSEQQQVAAPAPPQPAVKQVKQLRLRSAAAYLPHPDKESYGGEDAHFVSSVFGGALGVADGVGGWAESGVNPAEYSRTFMRVACAYLEGADVREVASSYSSTESSPCATLSSVDNWNPLSSDEAAVVDPRGALDTAHKLTRVPGSATACVMQLDPEKRALIGANLGDSGFVVVRDGQIAMRSSPKQHFFDCPLQFGAYPDYVDGTDTADDAEFFQLPVQPGDVIIAGTDGLWDNVYGKELLRLVPTTPEGIDNAADKIARLARRHASDPEFASPYTAEAKAQGLDWPLWMKLMNTKFKDGKVQIGELTGGKMDDITVLVAMVEEVGVELPDSAAAEAVTAPNLTANEAAAVLDAVAAVPEIPAEAIQAATEALPEFAAATDAAVEKPADLDSVASAQASPNQKKAANDAPATSAEAAPSLEAAVQAVSAAAGPIAAKAVEAVSAAAQGVSAVVGAAVTVAPGAVTAAAVSATKQIQAKLEDANKANNNGKNRA